MDIRADYVPKALKTEFTSSVYEKTESGSFNITRGKVVSARTAPEGRCVRGAEPFTASLLPYSPGISPAKLWSSRSGSPLGCVLSFQGTFNVRLKALKDIGGQHVCSLPKKDREGVIHVKPTSLSDSLKVRASIICDVCSCEQVRGGAGGRIALQRDDLLLASLGWECVGWCIWVLLNPSPLLSRGSV